MKHVLIRLDDACEYRNIANWKKVEEILDTYNTKPLVGVIPSCEDESLKEYDYDSDFWNLATVWQNKGWSIALHGYTHVYCTTQGGINPVNARSEFAGLPLREQKEKIKNGMNVFKEKGINASAFFAPSHTFDENTLVALQEDSDIRVISDCIANRPYYENGFFFLPEQTGSTRNLPFHFVTVCLHPNSMQEKDFVALDQFLKRYFKKTVDLRTYNPVKRNRSLYDKFLRKLYFTMRNIRHR